MKKHYRHENDCLNCGTILEGKFCHHCGQENLQIRENFGHMMNHAVSDYFHFDHQFFHTLKPLLLKPGKLTNEYMAGRRVQYLHPIKMYIFISIVYFLLLFQSAGEKTNAGKVSGNRVTTGQAIDSAKKAIEKSPGLSAAQKKKLVNKLKEKKLVTYYGFGKITEADTDNNDKHSKYGWFRPSTDDSTYHQYAVSQEKLPKDEKDNFLQRQWNKKTLSYHEKYGSMAGDIFLDEFKHNIPKMMFLLLPLFALILKLAFWKNKKYYVEHLIYSFHFHCFLFLFLAFFMLLQLIIPDSWGIIMGWLDFFATIYIMWYVYRSLRTVYHRSRFRTISKMIGMSFMYSFAFAFCISLIMFITYLF
ncbi:MAG: DUF3667 domain-containing protein [Bacteroidota bacterium]|nr:DUF3667 domain-containing protein [Bacteroidota bacterium]